MEKRVFIVHGWGGSPNEPMHIWLKKELEKKGLKVISEEMPNTEEPNMDSWVSHLSKLVGKLDENTYFIGHSIGCQTIMRFLEKQNSKIGGAIFIAGWFKLDNLEEIENEIAKPWLTKPIEFKKVKRNINKLTVILSNNDPFNQVEFNSNIFKKELGAKVIIKNKMGHFTEENGITELPDAINELMEIIK